MIAVGVDTHKHRHVAVALSPLGELLGEIAVAASGAGYRELVSWLAGLDGEVMVGIEGAGSYGAGLCRHLQAVGISVVEVERPRRRDRRQGKSDRVDALLAAKRVLAGDGVSTPRRRRLRHGLARQRRLHHGGQPLHGRRRLGATRHRRSRGGPRPPDLTRGAPQDRHGQAVTRHTERAWQPRLLSLSVYELGGRVRLVPHGLTHAEGASLQEAGDELVHRVLVIAMAFRASGIGLINSECHIDLALLDFVYEVGEIAARSGDIRPRLFSGEHAP
jgi:Transposase